MTMKLKDKTKKKKKTVWLISLCIYTEKFTSSIFRWKDLLPKHSHHYDSIMIPSFTWSSKLLAPSCRSSLSVSWMASVGSYVLVLTNIIVVGPCFAWVFKTSYWFCLCKKRWNIHLVLKKSSVGLQGVHSRYWISMAAEFFTHRTVCKSLCQYPSCASETFKN